MRQNMVRFKVVQNYLNELKLISDIIKDEVIKIFPIGNSLRVGCELNFDRGLFHIMI